MEESEPHVPGKEVALTTTVQLAKYGELKSQSHLPAGEHLRTI